MYWNTNNIFSIIQTLALKNNAVKKYFDIPDIPKVEETPVFKLRNPFSSLAKGMQQVNQPIEVIDPSKPPPPPTSDRSKPSGQPVTFTAPPKK